ncbi:MAG: NAD(P)/FAD-dependent oxidoreductase, partial [Verrucomicrobiota bacterium]
MDPIKTELVVVGAGPGGYAAAFYAADLGKRVILIEKEKRLGGVCLNRGCIPSKALLYATHQIVGARESAHRGITFTEPKIELEKLRAWKESVLAKLSGGVASLAKMRGVQVIAGRGYFEGSNKLRVETEQGQQFIEYDQAILAVGSLPAMPKAFDLGNPRVMTSTEALEVEDIPENLLVVGGGYIGMEMGTVYAALGSKITLVEALDSILAGADADLARPVVTNAKKLFKEVRLKSKVSKMSTVGKQIKVESEYNGEKLSEIYDRVLVSVGRVANSKDLGLENTKVELDERGF